MRTGVDQDVLRFNIAVADSFCMYVGYRSQQLIGVHLYQQVGNHLLHLKILLHYAVRRIRNVVHNHVQVYLIWLVAVRVKRLPHFDTVRMMQHLKYLKFSVLVALILKDFLNGDGLASFSDDGFEHNTKRPIPNNFLRVVSKTLLHKTD